MSTAQRWHTGGLCNHGNQQQALRMVRLAAKVRGGSVSDFYIKGKTNKQTKQSPKKQVRTGKRENLSLELSKQVRQLLNAAERRYMSEDWCSEPRTPEWIRQLRKRRRSHTPIAQLDTSHCCDLVACLSHPTPHWDWGAHLVPRSPPPPPAFHSTVCPSFTFLSQAKNTNKKMKWSF